MFPPTTRRVEQSAPESTNRRIARETRGRILHYAAHPGGISHRLAELDLEWDMERTLEANAATLGLAGTLLGAFWDKRFLAVPILVTSFLLQHALQGWCPPVPLFRSRGVRTATEIAQERYALLALRGDFREVESGSAPDRAHAALHAVELA